MVFIQPACYLCTCVHVCQFYAFNLGCYYYLHCTFYCYELIFAARWLKVVECILYCGMNNAKSVWWISIWLKPIVIIVWLCHLDELWDIPLSCLSDLEYKRYIGRMKRRVNGIVTENFLSKCLTLGLMDAQSWSSIYLWLSECYTSI